MTIEELKEKIRNDNPYFKNREIKDYQVYDLLDFNVEKDNAGNISEGLVEGMKQTDLTWFGQFAYNDITKGLLIRYK